MPEPEEIQLGTISFTGKDIGGHECQFDRIAVNNSGRLFLLSIIGDQMKVKAIRAILNGGAKASIQATGVKVRRASAREGWAGQSLSGTVFASETGYNCWTHKLGYGQVHCMFQCRDPGFMNLINRDSLWLELSDTRFTTPVLPEWLEYLEKELKSKNKLEYLKCHRCECGLLTAVTSDLDLIVEAGLGAGVIKIPTESKNEIIAQQQGESNE